MDRGKVIVSQFVTLDGVVENPDGWAFRFGRRHGHPRTGTGHRRMRMSSRPTRCSCERVVARNSWRDKLVRCSMIR